MSTSDVSRTVLPSVFRLAVPFLDPRRWFGTLFALAGIAASIVATVLPRSVIRHVIHPPQSALPRRRPVRASRSDPSLRTLSRRHSSKFAHLSSVRLPNQSIRIIHRRPHTAGEIPSPAHVTSAHSPPRFVSNEPILTSSSNSPPNQSPPQEPSPLPPLPDTEKTFQEPESVSSLAYQRTPLLPPILTSTAPLISFHNHPDALKSLDCLDLATPELSSPNPHLKLSQNSKRPFRLPLPKLGFKKRRSVTELDAARDEAPLFTQPREVEKLKQNRPFEKKSQTSSVKRSSTISTPSAQPREEASSTHRRRFSLFYKEGHVGKDKGRDKDAALSPPLLQTASPDPPIPVPALPSPNTLNSMISSLPPKAIDRPSVTRYIPPASPLRPSSSPVTSHTPPLRPARTDPYKTYGVPVPGSERARAFLRAEKEMRAEREKRARADRSDREDSQSFGSGSDKSKGSVTGDVEGRVNSRTKADAEGGTFQAQDSVDEFGMVGGPSPPPERTSLQGRRRSLLGRGRSESQQVQEREASKSRSGKRKGKEEDFRGTSTLIFRDPFGTREDKGSNARECGYVSETACSR